MTEENEREKIRLRIIRLYSEREKTREWWDCEDEGNRWKKKGEAIEKVKGSEWLWKRSNNKTINVLPTCWIDKTLRTNIF